MSYVFLNLGYPSGDLTIFYGKWSMYRWIDDLWWFSFKHVIFYDKITTWYLNYITSGLSVGPSLSTSGAVYDWCLGDRLQWRCFLLAQCPDRMAFPLVHLLKSPVETNMPLFIRTIWGHDKHCPPSVGFIALAALFCFVSVPLMSFEGLDSTFNLNRTLSAPNSIGTLSAARGMCRYLQVANNNWCLQTTIWTWVVLRMARAWSGHLFPAAAPWALKEECRNAAEWRSQYLVWPILLLGEWKSYDAVQMGPVWLKPAKNVGSHISCFCP